MTRKINFFVSTMNLSGHLRKKLNALTCSGSGVVDGKIVPDLLNSLNSRRCKKLLLGFFFHFLHTVLYFGAGKVVLVPVSRTTGIIKIQNNVI